MVEDDDAGGSLEGWADEHEPTRVCPHCATVTQTAGEYCPHCGKAYERRGRVSKRTGVAALIVLLLLVAGGAAAVVLVKHNEDEQAKKKQAAALAAALAARRHTEQAHREAEDEQKIKRASEERERHSDEQQLEHGVEKDAKKLVSEETLSEPVLGATCSPASGGSSTELSSATGTFSCIAITKRESGGNVSGYRFSGTIDFTTGSISYHLGG
jgi:hypothetical protein